MMHALKPDIRAIEAIEINHPACTKSYASDLFKRSRNISCFMFMAFNSFRVIAVGSCVAENETIKKKTAFLIHK